MKYLDLLRISRSLKILVVDDHNDFLEGVKTYLEIAGYEAITSRSIYDAVNKLKRHADIQFVISDFDFKNCPHNGLYLHGILQQMSRKTPLLLLTMIHNPEIIRNSIEKGANGFILKENCFEDILLAIDHIQHGNIFLCSQSHKILEKCH